MSDIASPGLFDRAIRRINTIWRDMAAGVEDVSIAAQMRACLNGRGGEVSARNRAAKLAETYLELDVAGRTEFLRTLASFDSDADAVAAPMPRYRLPRTPPNSPPPRRRCVARWIRLGCAC